MHELSIAMGLVEAAAEEARRHGDVRVDALYVRIGALAGVVREALEFSFDMAAAGTPVAGARLVIEEVPVTARCVPCASDRVLPSIQDFRCPECGTPTSGIVAGRELELTALEIEDHDSAHR